MRQSVQLLAAALLLVCLCTPATAFSFRDLLQSGTDTSNPWRAYMMQQRGNMRPANGMRPSDIAYLPLSDSAAKMQIYATYDSAAGAITKIRATGDYQFCTAAEGDTQCAPAAACTGSFATDSPCTIYGGLGPCGVAVKGARRGGVTPAGGFSIRLDMRANEVGMCPRRRAAARRLMQTPVLMTIQMQSNDNEMEDDQNTNYDDPDPTEQKPMDDEEDTPVVTPPVTTTVTPVMMPATPIKPVAMPTQIPTTPTMIPTSTINKPIITTNVPITTTTNVPITTTSSNDDMEPDQTVTNDGQDPTGLQQDDGMDDGDNSPMVTDDQDYTDYDVPLTTTGGGSGGGGGGGRGNSKSKLMFYGGACEVALLIKNAGTSNCYCFTGVTSARVGRRAPRMASGNGGSQRGPVYKRWKCKDLVPKTGAACTCEA